MIYLEINETDSEMLSIISERNGKRILWAIVHEDILSELEVDKADMENIDVMLQPMLGIKPR